jgi:hypothetical protein
LVYPRDHLLPLTVRFGVNRNAQISPLDQLSARSFPVRRDRPSVTIEGASGKAAWCRAPTAHPADNLHPAAQRHGFQNDGIDRDMLAGAILMFLTVSGPWVHIDMCRRRKNAGKRGLFWH